MESGCNQHIIVTDNEIHINTHYFVHRDYAFTGKELFWDIFSNFYKSQNIVISSYDGENLIESGVYSFLIELFDYFKIPNSTIHWNTHDTCPENEYSYEQALLGIFSFANVYLNQNITHNPTFNKFIGTSIGRLTPTRLRLIYEMDHEFANNAFIIFQPPSEWITRNYSNYSNIYEKELTWLSNRTFDNIDIQTGVMGNGSVGWQDSYTNYHNICNEYCIEIISETDVFSDFWFTEKTARCLASGKPFVLLSGTGSLKTLRSMGFKTFDSIIDESYDNIKCPTEKIKLLISSLKSVYNSIYRDEYIRKLYDMASDNISIYKSKYS